MELSPMQIKALTKQALSIKELKNGSGAANRVIMGDSFKVMDCLPPQFVDLMIVDPPYNLTKNFGQSTFREMDFKAYKEWLDSWLKKTVRLMRDNASIYICSDWKTSICIPEIASKYFVLRNRISWEREKGRGATNNWKNCLEDIWFFTKGEDYKFNLDAVKIQRPVIAPYRDESGKPKDWADSSDGKVRLTHPSNVWTDISIPFWSMAENTPHPTQKPEKLLAKLILASSDAGDMVFDPFAGSGTTAVTAKKLGRQFTVIEKEPEYCAYTLKRLELADTDRVIQGFENGFFKARNC